MLLRNQREIRGHAEPFPCVEIFEFIGKKSEVLMGEGLLDQLAQPSLDGEPAQKVPSKLSEKEDSPIKFSDEE